MRLAIKTTLFLTAAYTLILGGLALGVRYRLRTVENDLTRQTSQLLGHEIAAAMSEASLSRILSADPPARKHLREMISGLTEGSQIVEAITVVNELGTVVGSDRLEVGSHLEMPRALFGATPRVHYAHTGGTDSPHGTYTLIVPLQRAGFLAGYLRITLNSGRIAGLYAAAHRELLIAALGGLAIIGLVGFLIHMEATRRAQSLARTLDEIRRGRAPALPRRRDEFSTALETAGRLGRELTRAREDSSRAQRRFGALTESMNVGVLLLGPDRHIEYASPRTSEMFGCPSAEALGKRWAEFAGSVGPALDRLEEGRGASTHVEVEFESDGARCRLHLDLLAVREDALESYLVLVKDRGMIEALETDLRLATQLRGFAHLYMAVAHDLRAPLSAMVTNLELLRDTFDESAGDGSLRERQRSYVEVLREELRRLDQSLYTVLTQTAPPRETEESFDLRVLMLEIERFLAAQARRQRVKLELALPQSDVPLRARRDRLKQAFLNVAINALEAMPHGGRIAVGVGVEGGYARVSITDTGPGIPPEALTRVFDMHFTTKETGTGVGLYVTRSVIEAEGGEIRVESEPRRGSRFEIVLPLASDV